MKAWQVQTPDGIEAIKQVEIEQPVPADNEILVKMQACALNYRDLLIANGGYPRNETRPVVPVSDGAGEVVAVGSAVVRHKPGDRVISSFFRDWISGPPDEAAISHALGGGIDGTLSEYFILREDAALPIPDSLSYAEAATLPCAALTAWHALVPLGQLKAGDVVLTQGTGGVSMFTLQFAKAIGATVIVTSSSDEKLAFAKKMGADHGINYQAWPDWEQQVLELTNGQGVDHVIEVAGEKTFEKSIVSTRINGTISVIGILSGFDIPFSLLAALNLLHINGIYVGSVAMCRDMLEFIEQHDIHPVIDQEFDFDQALDAYRHMASARHIGKIVITA